MQTSGPHLDGSNLRELRQAQGLSQDQLAAKAGVTKLTVQNLEAGRSKGYPLTWRALSEALGLTTDVA